MSQGEYAGDILVDMEAGLEHLSRGTGRHVERILAVLEPYYRSMETASRVSELAKELGIAEILIVSNKVRDDADRQAIATFCEKRGLKFFAEIPHDSALAEAERSGKSPIEHAPNSPAMQAVRALAKRLVVAALCLFTLTALSPTLLRAQSAGGPGAEALRQVGQSDLGGAGFNGAVAMCGPAGSGTERVVVGVALFDALGEPARRHHEHAVGDPLDQVEVVRDEEIGDSRLLLQRSQEVEDLLPCRCVE